MNQVNDIRDDEFRVLGRRGIDHLNLYDEMLAHDSEMACEKKKKRKTPLLWAALGFLLLLGLAAWLLWPKADKPDGKEGVFDPLPTQAPPPEAARILPLGIQIDSLHPAFTEKLDTTINDVVLSLYIPHNTSSPVLTVGAPSPETRKAVLAFQAADIRADNREILGSFVQKGKILARGKSKDGFCAIIDGQVYVGVEENTSLFERAVEQDGYFFRQFSLVKNGVLEESEIKNKTMRKALCDRAGQIFVAVSETDESMHDFAQALVDLGVDNAIYLVGSHSAFGWYRDEAGEQTYFGADVHRQSFRNENYIVWK